MEQEAGRSIDASDIADFYLTKVNIQEYNFGITSEQKGDRLMSKRKTGAIPVNAPKEKKKMVIDMNRANLAKSYQQPGFRTGRHMTEKDRPRKKNWKKDYYGDPGTGSFC